MRYLALASDYDGTLAHDGRVDAETLKALDRLRQSGRKTILVTGRELPDLQRTFEQFELFDVIVAENGALMFTPRTREKKLLAPAPPPAFLEDLKKRGVAEFSTGEAIVATWQPHESAVLESIRAVGLDLQVIFNKEAVMVLPTGVNKMTGLAHALDQLKLSRHNVVAVGDAQNDLPFLEACECAVAVENALPALKEQVDWVTEGARGAGVTELIDRLVTDDLSSLATSLDRRGIRVGVAGDKPVFIAPRGESLLLCGQSGSGKSTFVAGIVERLLERGYQTCVIDPEGDYEELEGFFTLGDQNQAPSFDQILQILDRTDSNLSINLVGIKIEDRPTFFASLLARLQEKFVREGRPHWLIVDEAHHLLPSEWAPAAAAVEGGRPSMVLVTVHPEHVSPAALALIDVLAVVGKEPGKVVDELGRIRGIEPPAMPAGDLAQGDAFVWFLESAQAAGRGTIDPLHTEKGKAERKRHKRKYAEGELEPDRTFRFRGSEGKLNLRAQNLNLFVQIAEGIDDGTWLYHLKRGDYSNWIAQAIKDQDLATAVRVVEQHEHLSPGESRKRIAQTVRDRYTV